MPKNLKITLKRSTIGHLQRQKRTVQALGLRKINQSVIHTDNQMIRGMINTVAHLVTVEEVD